MTVALQDKLNKSRYRTFEQFIDDVKLMVSNAQTYNKPGDPVHEMAKDLWNDFNKEWLPAVINMFSTMVALQQFSNFCFMSSDSVSFFGVAHVAAVCLADSFSFEHFMLLMLRLAAPMQRECSWDEVQ